MRNRLTLTIVLLAMALVSSCSDPVGTITYESPELPDGKRELVIKATDSKDAPISGFNLQITGPTTANATVSGSEYVLTDLASGLYTITITKDGYIGASYQLPVVLPNNPKADFTAAKTVKVTQLTPPVPVNVANGGTVQAPGPSATGPRSQPTQVTIPPGAIPGSGTAQVSVTRTAPTPIIQTTQPAKAAPGLGIENTVDRIALDGFIVTVTNNGSTVNAFNAPVTVNISLEVPSSIRNEQFNFVLMSGSGPGATPTSESRPITIDAGNGNGTASILKPGTYKVYATLGLTTATAQSTFSIGTTSCGLGGSFAYSSPTPAPVGPVLTFLGIVPTASTPISGTIAIDAVTGAATSVSGTNTIIDYTVRRPNVSSSLESYRYPLAQVVTTVSINNCHNSGGV